MLPHIFYLCCPMCNKMNILRLARSLVVFIIIYVSGDVYVSAKPDHSHFIYTAGICRDVQPANDIYTLPAISKQHSEINSSVSCNPLFRPFKIIKRLFVFNSSGQLSGIAKSSFPHFISERTIVLQRSPYYITFRRLVIWSFLSLLNYPWIFRQE